MMTIPRPFAPSRTDAPDADYQAAPLSRLQASPAEAEYDAAAEDRLAESFWLKEAKAALRSRDPVDAANDVEALALWADLQCGDILQTSTATFQRDQNG